MLVLAQTWAILDEGPGTERRGYPPCSASRRARDQFRQISFTSPVV